MDQLSQTIHERARAKIERALSFSGGGDDMLSPGKKARTPRDQMSHRIIEKRRRDRMNNCLANLSQLIPVNYLKQGQGRIEKTEIIEMANRHITHLQKQVQAMSTMERPCCQEKFLMGYKECRDEVMRFLVEKSGYDAADPFCLTLLKHLHKQSQKFVPESATSVYQNTHGSHQGLIGAEDMMMPQNAGEVGGMFGDTDSPSATRLSPASLSAMASENKHNPASPWMSSLNESPPSSELRPAATSSPAMPAVERAGASSASPVPNFARHLLQQVPVSAAGMTMPSLPLASVSGESGYNSSGRDILSGESGYNSSGRDVPCREGSITSSNSHTQVQSSSPVSSGMGTVSSPLLVADNTDAESNNSKQAYKFKNIIKQRFTGNCNPGKPGSSPEISDQNSNSSKEEMEYLIRPDSLKVKTDSDWTMVASEPANPVKKRKIDVEDKEHVQQQTNSDGAGAAGADVKEDFTNDSKEPGSSGEVPAFALHPMGTYYVPLVIKMAQLSPYLHTNNSMQLCHPISIPVNFSRPRPSEQVLKPCPSPQQQQEASPSSIQTSRLVGVTGPPQGQQSCTMEFIT